MFPFFSPFFFSRARRKTPANSPVLAARSSISASNHVAAVVMRVIVLNVFFLPFRCCFFFYFFFFLRIKISRLRKVRASMRLASRKENKPRGTGGGRRGDVYLHARGEERRGEKADG